MLLLATQNIPFRGNKKENLISCLKDRLMLKNHGNFLQILDYCAENDKKLEKFLKTNNDFYSSKDIQNEILSTTALIFKNPIK